MLIRRAAAGDDDAIWAIMEPILRDGETYTLPRDTDRKTALAYWRSAEHEDFLRANQKGGGGHVANCGYMTAASATGRGVARAMCAHSLERARERGFRAMQFNFVVSTNERAVRLWQSFDFEIVGRLPKAFLHPMSGYVDAYILYREL